MFSLDPTVPTHAMLVSKVDKCGLGNTGEMKISMGDRVSAEMKRGSPTEAVRYR